MTTCSHCMNEACMDICDESKFFNFYSEFLHFFKNKYISHDHPLRCVKKMEKIDYKLEDGRYRSLYALVLPPLCHHDVSDGQQTQDSESLFKVFFQFFCKNQLFKSYINPPFLPTYIISCI